MTHLPLVYFPDRRLKTVCDAVLTIDREVETLVENMMETMYKEDGIGLAAPQVGSLKRIFVGDLDYEPGQTKKKMIVMINPEIIWFDEAEATRSEGCLSIPGIYVEMTRPQSVKVRYLDLKGEEQELKADELLARLIQHETDHLNGILMIDHLSSLKRNIIKTKVQKTVKERSNE